MRLRVDGRSPERLLNLCTIHSIVLWNVANRASFYEMNMSVRDFKRLRPLVRKTGTRIKIVRKCGLPFFLYRFRRRKMFFGGMLFSAALVYTLSLFVWNIHFTGNVTQSTTELLAFLETLGVKHGVKKSDIVCETIETKLRNKYPEILWVSAELRGTRIIVRIKENEDKDIVSKTEKPDGTPVSIVSETDGVVKSIITRRGTPLVKAGDEVTAGQTLVAGWYEVKNDAGEIIRCEGVPADADILIGTTEQYRDAFPAEYEKKLYTGKKRHGLTITLFEKKWSYTPKLRRKSYTKYRKNLRLRLTENFYLPLSAEFYTYAEYRTEKQPYTKEQIKRRAEHNFRKNYEIILQKGVQIIEKDVKIDTNGKLCSVSGTVKLLVPVHKKVPVAVPETGIDISQEGEN